MSKRERVREQLTLSSGSSKKWRERVFRSWVPGSYSTTDNYKTWDVGTFNKYFLFCFSIYGGQFGGHYFGQSGHSCIDKIALTLNQLHDYMLWKYVGAHNIKSNPWVYNCPDAGTLASLKLSSSASLLAPDSWTLAMDMMLPKREKDATCSSFSFRVLASVMRQESTQPKSRLNHGRLHMTITTLSKEDMWTYPEPFQPLM